MYGVCICYINQHALISFNNNCMQCCTHCLAKERLKGGGLWGDLAGWPMRERKDLTERWSPVTMQLWYKWGCTVYEYIMSAFEAWLTQKLPENPVPPTDHIDQVDLYAFFLSPAFVLDSGLPSRSNDLVTFFAFRSTMLTDTLLDRWAQTTFACNLTTTNSTVLVVQHRRAVVHHKNMQGVSDYYVNEWVFTI